MGSTKTPERSDRRRRGVGRRALSSAPRAHGSSGAPGLEEADDDAVTPPGAAVGRNSPRAVDRWTATRQVEQKQLAYMDYGGRAWRDGVRQDDRMDFGLDVVDENDAIGHAGPGGAAVHVLLYTGTSAEVFLNRRFIERLHANGSKGRPRPDRSGGNAGSTDTGSRSCSTTAPIPTSARTRSWSSRTGRVGPAGPATGRATSPTRTTRRRTARARV